jgi:hypothetical protein
VRTGADFRNTFWGFTLENRAGLSRAPFAVILTFLERTHPHLLNDFCLLFSRDILREGLVGFRCVTGKCDWLAGVVKIMFVTTPSVYWMIYRSV